MVFQPVFPGPPFVGEAYLLRATFDAVNQGFTNGQVLDTVAEGISRGRLTVVAVDGTLAIVSNKCSFTAQTTKVWSDLGFYSQAITKQLGRSLLSTYNGLSNEASTVGWHDVAALPASGYPLYEMYFHAGGFINVGGGVDIIAYSTDTDYERCLVLGGYHSNGVPWRSGQAAASYLNGASFFIKGGVFSDWTLGWRTASNNTATLYAVASNYDDVGTIDNFRVPAADLSAVLQPNNLSTMGSVGELDAYSPDVGSGWTEDIGDWDTAAGTLKATTLGIATFTGLADCLYDAKITMPGAGTTAGGLVLRVTDLTGASEDYWYVKITPGTAGTDWELIEYVNGAATQRASGDVDWAAATAYAIRAICDGQEIACFADGGDKISYASVASGETATSLGLRDEGNANFSFDNVVVFARTGDIYNPLDVFF